MKNLITANIPIGPSGSGFTGIGTGPLANPNGGAGAVSVFSGFISDVIGVMTIVAIIWAVFSLITGAIGIISSGGDKQALENARKKITTGIIGLIIVIIALLIIELIGYFLGVGDLLNITNLFSLIK
ncbi:MAG TPA: hypothetical protein VMR19_01125 [Candidatus Saccharimonadales bacterium]|jgi:hypothetical protein|nr:hypothetical protein [Candidatus Saccharimonadales bacterium]